MFADITKQLHLEMKQTLRTAAEELIRFFSRPPGQIAVDITRPPYSDDIMEVLLGFYIAYKRKVVSGTLSSDVLKSFCKFYGYREFTIEEQYLTRYAYFIIVDVEN